MGGYKRFWRRQNLLPLKGIKTRIVQPLASSLNTKNNDVSKITMEKVPRLSKPLNDETFGNRAESINTNYWKSIPPAFPRQADKIPVTDASWLRDLKEDRN
jgi:hypothetical protein